MAEKRFDTRILLKYDSLSNWNSSSLVLKAGEVAIATVPTSEAVQKQDGIITPPAAVVFKVGDGEHTFKDLPLVSGLAADVYGWAKKSEEEFKEWLDKTAAFATDEELSKVKAALDAKDKALEDLISAIEGGGEGSGSEGGLTGVYSRLSDLETILVSFLPEGEKTADAVKVAIDAVASSVSSLEERVEANEGEISGIKAANVAMNSKIANIEKELSGEGLAEGEVGIREQIANVQGDVEAIEEKIGEVATDKTLVGMIGEVEQAAKDYADGKVAGVVSLVGALEPRVKANEDAIALLNGEGEGSVKAAVASGVAEIVAGADKDFDTLKEVADWILNDKTGAAALQAAVSSHTASIGDLSNSVAGLVSKDGELEGSISDLQSQINAITGGEGATGSLVALEARVKANEDAIDVIEEKIGDVAEGKTLAGLIAANVGAISSVSGTVGSHATLIEGLRTDLDNEIARATEEEGKLSDAIAAEVTRATKAEEEIVGAINGLKEVARTGMINDLGQVEGEELIFDCGNSGFVASV